ncbi:MAG: hypothetical protein VKJ02_11885 [Snowella sp.]|nr:hypothetical protein [Snowella sp.]
MFVKLRRLISQFFNKSSTINNEPLNKVSLIVIILIDIFILINVFNGLNDISNWHLNPNEQYPCYSEWNNFQKQSILDKEYRIIRSVLSDREFKQFSLPKSNQLIPKSRLGQVNEVCLRYATYRKRVNNRNNQKIANNIDGKQQQINQLTQANQTLRSQYDSTLLEKIAGQPQNKSINQVTAEKTKEQLAENDRRIIALKDEINDLKKDLLTPTSSLQFLNFLNNKTQFEPVNRGYQKAVFWYPTIQFAFQSLFLLPLIFVGLSIHRFAQRKNYGLISLISWHLLVIFLIPLILKVFEFLQFGVIFDFLIKIIQTIFGGLLFLISYLYILLIPLIGFGIIKFFQTFIFNPKGQATKRFQQSRCLRCAKRIRPQDAHCPHCGYHQYTYCAHCHKPTYKHLSYCKHCGSAQDIHDFIQ